MPAEQHAIPTHSISATLMAEPLDYENPYDFKRLHRHEYFEIILVNEGQGSQVIDFSEYHMEPGAIYGIYPGQIHLMRRCTANGLLLQFPKEIFRHLGQLRHFYFFFHNPVFIPPPADFAHLYSLAARIKELAAHAKERPVTEQKIYAYLQVILLSLRELRAGPPAMHDPVAQFLALLTEHVHSKKKVAEYCAMMGITAERLNDACRNALGKTALQIVHSELLLEIKRLLLTDKMTLKEIAYHLNFDSPGNFSAFVKQHTGATPTELHDSLLHIHK